MWGQGVDRSPPSSVGSRSPADEEWVPPAPPSTLSSPMRVPYTLAGVNLSMGKKGSPPFFPTPQNPPYFSGFARAGHARTPGRPLRTGPGCRAATAARHPGPSVVHVGTLCVHRPDVLQLGRHASGRKLAHRVMGHGMGAGALAPAARKGGRGGKNGYRVARTQPLLAGVCDFPSRVVASFATRG